MKPGQRKIEAYLPKGSWKLWGEDKEFQGAASVQVDCPLDTMPVFIKQ